MSAKRKLARKADPKAKVTELSAAVTEAVTKIQELPLPQILNILEAMASDLQQLRDDHDALREDHDAFQREHDTLKSEVSTLKRMAP